ncbi:MAG: hypothetical protein KME10_07725 [Plectolyngbya sp. WJT66-NPBG17]|nr:hypothetical protein [Plectolyngbya sp. WJT66-NPBG17]
MTTASIAKLPVLTWQFGAIAHCCWRFPGTIGNSEITPFLIHAFIPSNWRDSLFEDERDRTHSGSIWEPGPPCLPLSICYPT